MKSFLAVLTLFAAITAHAQSAKLATYEGRFYNDDGRILLDQGQWTKIPKECKPYVDTRTENMGFAAWDQKKRFTGISQCDLAVVTLDLENSSFCKDQGGAEMYYAPKVVAVQCL